VLYAIGSHIVIDWSHVFLFMVVLGCHLCDEHYEVYPHTFAFQAVCGSVC